MKRVEKSRQGVAEKEENLGEKLRRGVLVGKSGGLYTPTLSWRLWAAHETIINQAPPLQPPTVSARKLAAALWEFHHYLPLFGMHRGVSNGGGGGGAGDSRLRRLHHSRHPYKEKGLDLSHFLADASPGSSEQPESASSLRRHIAQSLMQHHRALERSNRAIQPLSPASYGSSMEVAPYNPAVTPSSSLDFKGRVGESHYNLKTSTELLKVLNRIWSLEEQHSSNVSLIKALRIELDHARLRIKELLRDQQADRREMDDLMKQIAEEKLVRKSKEQDRIHAAVQSARDELEDERKLRKRSESLHRKLARELSELKSSIPNALKELERERKSRKLLEDLCDEFAKGIKEYEQEVHALRQKSDDDWAGRAEQDRLILHISESWLDERMQMKLEEAQSGFAENNSIVDKLGFEIETFLQAKRASASKSTNVVPPRNRRKSMESIAFNETGNEPRDVGHEEESEGSDSNCFEINKPNNSDLKPLGDEAIEGHIEEIAKRSQSRKAPPRRERFKGRNPSSLQVKFEEQMAWAMSCNGNKNTHLADSEHGKANEGNPVEISFSRKSENCEASEEGGSQERNKKLDEEDKHGSNLNYVIDNLIRNHIAVSDGVNVQLPENDCGEASSSYPSRRNQASPVRQWMSKLPTPTDLEIAESSTRLPPAPRENTLKAKLLEARSKGQRTRLKFSKG